MSRKSVFVLAAVLALAGLATEAAARNAVGSRSSSARSFSGARSFSAPHAVSARSFSAGPRSFAVGPRSFAVGPRNFVGARNFGVYRGSPYRYGYNRYRAYPYYRSYPLAYTGCYRLRYVQTIYGVQPVRVNVCGSPYRSVYRSIYGYY